VNAFEKLADEPFLKPPENQESCIDSVWSRLVKKARSELENQKIFEELKAKGFWNEESDN
jgi:hypothetical protein